VSALYPVMLAISRLNVLVVGGGEVALRKVQGLLEADALPHVISPQVVPGLKELIERHGLDWKRRRYAAGDAEGFHLVFTATDDPEVNASVARDADDHGALANVADDPDAAGFHVPATIRAGDVTVAFSTGGASPLLARRLRERLESVVTPGLGRAANRLAAARTEVRARWPEDESRRRAAWHDLITPDFLDAAIAGRDHEVELRIARCLSQS
jgi:precorrin-2 dehydrogenase/sirohydrochlorin ferrochelatase